jgi:hypothetical protein
MSQPPDRIEQLDDDLPYQRREWRAQRFGWWALTLFVAAAALGVFGGGPLSRATAASADGGLRLDYDRFVRSGAPARIFVHVAGRPAADPGGPLQLEFSRDFIDAIRLERVTPEPASILVGPDIVSLHLPNAGNGHTTVVLDFEPLRAGRLTGRVAAGGGPAITFTQLVYF